MSRQKLAKIDFRKQLKALYGAPSDRFVDIEVPALRFVKIDGMGDPNVEPAYALAVRWLYAVSYAIKFHAKAKLHRDYVVPPLEGLWWAEDPREFAARRKHAWCWTMMIMVPDFIDRAAFELAVDKARAKLGEPPPSLRFDLLKEGRCLQTLHIGSYDDEGPVLAKLHDRIMPAARLEFAGHHHEIYLSDPRKTPQHKLRTILRQPVRPAR